MATTTFDKNFSLAEKDANKFTAIMQTTGAPVLDKKFKSALVSEKEYRSELKKALGK